MRSASIAILLTLGLGSACGRKDDQSAAERPNPTQTPDVSSQNKKPIEPPLTQLIGVNKDVPVETFVVADSEVPERLRTDEMKVLFRSNLDQVSFECRKDEEAAFYPCPGGASHTFKPLVHGASYSLNVRAKSADGRVDRTPHHLAFVVDRVSAHEAPAVKLTENKNAEKIKNLPQVVPEAQADGTSPADREMQISGYYAVVVPYSMETASYSTTMTYSGQIQMLYNPNSSSYGTQPCTKNFERAVVQPTGARCCESTPTRVQLLKEYPRPLPQNHIELVGTAGGKPVEKLLVTAFDDDIDPQEGGINMAGICARAEVKGETVLPTFKKFLAADAEATSFQWCQLRSADGQWWWVGGFASRPGRLASHPRIRVVYSVSSSTGTASVSQFLARAGTVLPNVIVSMMPTD